MLNKLTVQGRITKDIELRKTQSGVSVCAFSIACDRDFKGANGQRETDFISCVAWRGTAEYLAKYAAKGRMLIVCGSLQSRKWQDKNGNDRVAWEVQVENSYLCDSKKQETAEDVQAKFDSYAEVDSDGELPFER